MSNSNMDHDRYKALLLILRAYALGKGMSFGEIKKAAECQPVANCHTWCLTDFADILSVSHVEATQFLQLLAKGEAW